MSSNKLKNNTTNWVLSALFLALAIVLPLFTGQLQELGNKILPMHIPVLLCGFLCGPIFGTIVGFISPLLRFTLFGMPTIFPIGITMCFELATYGLVSGYLYNILPKRNSSIYISLITSMLIGRVIWGISNLIIYGVSNSAFGWQAFITGAFINAFIGIIIQILIIPLLVIKLETIFCSHT